MSKKTRKPTIFDFSEKSLVQNEDLILHLEELIYRTADDQKAIRRLESELKILREIVIEKHVALEELEGCCSIDEMMNFYYGVPNRGGADEAADETDD